MSWSFNAMGSVEALRKALIARSEEISGDCKTEFDEVLLPIAALLAANAGEHYTPLKIQASGHKSYKDGKPTGGTCHVCIQHADSPLV
jgi:hypothetical protein